jgi:selenocysteine-specific elongation factor
MRRVIVGTAGHIDHGKTRLVEALTGTDCDRWAEEKERGITIDLGFAHLEKDDLQVGFVDVPGHERFLHNALAGLGGIRVMLLVVAADEGVKPQTREHLAICGLLGIPAGLVVLTKTDLVADDLLALARLEVEELLAESSFADAPVMAASSVTGDGIADLEATLLDLASRHAAEAATDRPTRLPIDRAFHLKGLGVVVTGTLASGSVSVGDELDIQPNGGQARVRGVQVHGTSRETAASGERTALQLGGATLDQLERGQQLVRRGAFAATTTLAARCRLLADAPKPIRGSTPVRLHLYSAEVVGRLRPLAGTLEPGDEGLVELRLARPVVAVRGDRFIVRRPSPPATIGGGEILDPQWRRRRGDALAETGRRLLGDVDDALLLWVTEAGESATAVAPLARRLGVEPAEIQPRLDRLAEAGQVLRLPAAHGAEPRWLAPGVWDRIAQRARDELAKYFRRQRLARGMPKAEAVRRILPGPAGQLSTVYLNRLTEAKILVVAGELVNLPGRSAELTGQESELSSRIQKAFEDGGLTPPAPAELGRRLGAKPQILEGVIRYLVERRRLVRLPGELIIAADAIERIKEDLRRSGLERFKVPAFKQRYGLTRKWAIPILEHLDSVGVTRRLGDERQVIERSSS